MSDLQPHLDKFFTSHWNKLEPPHAWGRKAERTPELLPLPRWEGITSYPTRSLFQMGLSVTQRNACFGEELNTDGSEGKGAAPLLTFPHRRGQRLGRPPTATGSPHGRGREAGAAADVTAAGRRGLAESGRRGLRPAPPLPAPPARRPRAGALARRPRHARTGAPAVPPPPGPAAAAAPRPAPAAGHAEGHRAGPGGDVPRPRAPRLSP